MVPDVLVLATQFNLADLSERAKRWMATHFRRIWEMQTFGSLPPSLLEECTKAVIDQMVCCNLILLACVIVFVCERVCMCRKWSEHMANYILVYTPNLTVS